MVIKKMLPELFNAARNYLNFKLRYPWVKLGKNVRCQWSVRFWSPNKKIIIGDNVAIGAYSTIHVDTEIGNHVMFASYVSLVGKDAHTTDMPGKTMIESPRGDKLGITIEDDVWLGFGAIILSGVTIGRGSIVAAGSVVTKNVEPYSIVASPAARKVGTRFNLSDSKEHDEELIRRSIIMKNSLSHK